MVQRVSLMRFEVRAAVRALGFRLRAASLEEALSLKLLLHFDLCTILREILFLIFLCPTLILCFFRDWVVQIRSKIKWKRKDNPSHNIYGSG